jgi:hypothetical protein
VFALPGIVALVVFMLARLLDFVEALRTVPFLHLFFALAMFGFMVDVRLGYIKLRATPQLFWALACIALALISDVVMAPEMLSKAALTLGIVGALFLVVGQGLGHFKALEVAAASVLACSVWIGAVCVHQGLQPLTCVAVDQKDDHTAMGRPDGRSCENIDQCYVDPPEPQALYRCEHAGMLGITSIDNGRVRYIGVLHDPNEVALTVSVALPIAVAFYQRRRSKLRVGLVAITGLIAAATVVMSQSRSGLIVFLAVMGVYFIKRFGVRGAVGAAFAVVPVLIYGGRAGQRAESSTTERLETWYEGLEMVRSYPVLGVGHGQFLQHHPLTAHNSVLLAAAECGLFGAILWTAVIYLSLKIPYRVLRDVREPEGEVARTWALSLMASVAGVAVGTLFLSFNYHFVLWVYVGMTAALWAAVRAHKPDFEVRFGWRDGALVAVGSLGLLALVFVATRAQLG